MYNYKIEISRYKRAQKWSKWNLIEKFDLVTEIKGWLNAAETLLSEMRRTNIDCFNCGGQTYVGTRARYNHVGYVRNIDETTMYKLEIVRTK